jgi:cyclase
MSLRVIARLDIKGPNLVKGIHLEGLRVLGKPEDFARHYYNQGADELIYMDVVASLYQRNSLLDIVRKTAREIFIPLTVGGGIRTIEDIRAVLRAGADKVALNTAVIADPELIKNAAETFGSSTVVVSIEAIRKPDGSYEAFTDNGRESTGVDALEWAVKAADLGAGEILLTSIDREGTGKGYDLELTQGVAKSVSIPVIAAGGAGKLEHIRHVVGSGADAVCIASMLHYGLKGSTGASGDFPDEGNVEYLKSGRSFSLVSPATLPEIKSYLGSNGITCRLCPMTHELRSRS